MSIINELPKSDGIFTSKNTSEASVSFEYCSSVVNVTDLSEQSTGKHPFWHNSDICYKWLNVPQKVQWVPHFPLFFRPKEALQRRTASTEVFFATVSICQRCEWHLPVSPECHYVFLSYFTFTESPVGLILWAKSRKLVLGSWSLVSLAAVD